VFGTSTLRFVYKLVRVVTMDWIVWS